MRFYSFTNALYMSPLQLGLQTGHCIAEMSQINKGKLMFDEWAQEHKTIIILDGGNNASLNSIFEFLNSSDNTIYPVAKFNEDEQSLNGAITSVGIVLPEEIYETARFVRSKCLKIYQLSQAENPQEKIAFDDGFLLANAYKVFDENERALLYKCEQFAREKVDQWTIDLIKLLNSCRLA